MWLPRSLSKNRFVTNKFVCTMLLNWFSENGVVLNCSSENGNQFYFGPQILPLLGVYHSKLPWVNQRVTLSSSESLSVSRPELFGDVGFTKPPHIPDKSFKNLFLHFSRRLKQSRR
ncbi:hypothetical protein VNO80_09605 [Phaseolus coccineus]|uniref:Uncharacterized protein n=1 Tax=Phaseolus coccineus TaxID=3886 RepID=A0AAN9N6H4_PHACN